MIKKIPSPKTIVVLETIEDAINDFFKLKEIGRDVTVSLLQYQLVGLIRQLDFPDEVNTVRVNVNKSDCLDTKVIDLKNKEPDGIPFNSATMTVHITVNEDANLHFEDMTFTRAYESLLNYFEPDETPNPKKKSTKKRNEK